MTTTAMLIILLLMVNIGATLISIYLNNNFEMVDTHDLNPIITAPSVILPNKEVCEQSADTGTKPPPPPYHRLILRAARQHELDPALLRAVIMAESSYNPNAVSNRGARGLMQLMPRTAAELGVKNCFDPEQNINGGARYLRKLLDRFDNDVQLALAAYNAGSRYVRKYNGIPPFRATHLYIKKVIKYQSLYRQKQTNDNGMV